MVSGSKLWQPFLYIKYSVINAFFFLQATFFSLLLRHSFWSRNLSLEWWCRLNVYIYAHELLFIKHLILDIEIEFVFLQSLIMDRKMINIQKHSNKAWNEPFSIGIDIHIAAIPQWMRWFSKWTTFILFVSISLTQSQIDGQSQLNATQLNYCDMCHTFILFINICIKMPPFAKCLPVQWSILFVESVYCKINDIDICLKWIESNICLIFYEHMST